MTSPETSLTWLGRLASAPGDDDWRRLVDAYGPLLATWLACAGVPACDRDDLVQEALLVVFRRVGEFEHRGPGAFRAWLRGIVANHARKHFEKRRTAPAIDLDAVAAPDSEIGRRLDLEHDRHLAARAMRIVEGDVAPSTWAAFRRQVVDGVPAEAVAAELGMTLNSVLLAKSRVLKRLRAALAGLVDP